MEKEVMAKSFVNVEIISKKRLIEYLQKELKKVNKQIEILNELRVKKPENVTKIYSSEDEFLTYVDNEINKNQRRVIEIEDGIQNNQTEIEELSSLNQAGRQIVLDKYIDENKVDSKSVDNFMEKYFSYKRFEVANYVQGSVLEMMKCQDEMTWLEPYAYNIATMEKIVQFSDEDIQELIEQLKNDKEMLKLVRKRSTINKNYGKMEEAIGGYFEVAGSVGMSAFVLAGVPAVIASLFGVQHSLVDAGVVVGGIGALTSVSAGLSSFIANAIENRVEKKKNIIDKQICNKICETVQEF